MSANYFVDTNVLLYAHDRSAGSKHEAARALIERLWQERSGAISTQVLQELRVNLARKLPIPLSGAVVREIISDYLTWHVVVNGGDAVLAAMELEERHQISFWDALIVAAAQASGANVLYSEDLNGGQWYGAVQVQNPFSQLP